MAENRTILLVDDNEAARYSTSRILAKEGFKVLEAATGTECLELAARKPALIILDIKLPDINGLEICQRLKSDPRTAAIPILQTSASLISSEDKLKGFESGADGYM